MKRSSKIVIAAITATGVILGTASLVSAQGGWGGNCNRANPMQGYGPMGPQGYGPMHSPGYGPGMTGCPLQGGQGFAPGMGPGCAGKGGAAGMRQRFADMGGAPGAKQTAQLARVKEQLKITPEQESAWSAFEEANEFRATARAERLQQRQAMSTASVDERVKLMRQRVSHMTVMADAIENLSAVLTDEQKALFGQINPMGRRR